LVAVAVAKLFREMELAVAVAEHLRHQPYL
jgi:hypothetical protein